MVKLIIVESPAKAKKISQLLGNGYIVKASMGHINELASENMGIDIQNGFEPTFKIMETKIKTVNDLKESAKKASEIILAGDADREGEAICYHVAKVLGLNVETSKRIVFHEITKKALQDAVNSPSVINMNLVKAQQSRQILDKLVGFEISPILWKQIQPKLSAGRVQSPLLNLVIERENEIEKFNSTNYFRTVGMFSKDENEFNGVLDKKFEKVDDMKQFLEDMKDATFSIENIKKGSKTKKPASPFTTSSLLQDAGAKLKLSSKQVMEGAQRLYEAGKISYHRTDCVNLSDEIINDIQGYIIEHYGEEYFKKTEYKNKAANAQEAHEAIRPTHIEVEVLEEESISLIDKKLYAMIWKRTVACQMPPARYETLEIKIENDVREEIFMVNGEKLIFQGFLKVYNFGEDTEEDTTELSPYELLENLKKNDEVENVLIEATEKFTQGQGRFTEATLIKKMQDTGIGRPSTYSSMIQKIQDRGYVVKDTRDAGKGTIHIFRLEKGEIDEKTRDITLKKEINKLFPTDVGKLTNKFLMENFIDLVKPDYTAFMEEKLDEIAETGINWRDIVKEFYDGFHPKVVELSGQSIQVNNPNSRLLGADPSGKQIIARVGPYGPMVQCGTKMEGDVRYASLGEGQTIDTITIGEAIELLKYPKNFGKYNGNDLMLKKGKYGFYLEYNKATFSLKNAGITNPDEITREKAIEIITTNNGYEKKTPTKKIVKGK